MTTTATVAAAVVAADAAASDAAADLPLEIYSWLAAFTVIFIGVKQRDNSSIIFCYDFECVSLGISSSFSLSPLSLSFSFSLFHSSSVFFCSSFQLPLSVSSSLSLPTRCLYLPLSVSRFFFLCLFLLFYLSLLDSFYCLLPLRPETCSNVPSLLPIYLSLFYPLLLLFLPLSTYLSFPLSFLSLLHYFYSLFCTSARSNLLPFLSIIFSLSFLLPLCLHLSLHLSLHTCACALDRSPGLSPGPNPSPDPDSLAPFSLYLSLSLSHSSSPCLPPPSVAASFNSIR